MEAGGRPYCRSGQAALLLLLLHLPALLGGTCAFRSVAPEFRGLLAVEGMEGEGGAMADCTHCHALTHRGKIISQGCWLAADGCSSTSCSLAPLGTEQLSFCCCRGHQCNMEPRNLESSEADSEADSADSADSAAAPSVRGRGMVVAPSARNTSTRRRAGQALPSLLGPPQQLSPTELGLLTALVLLLSLLLVLLVLLARQPRPAPASVRPILKGLQQTRKEPAPWAEERPLLLGLGVTGLLDLETCGGLCGGHQCGAQCNGRGLHDPERSTASWQ